MGLLLRAFGIRGDDTPDAHADLRARMDPRCRRGRHDWTICSVSFTGHDSNRRRRCDRCLGRGVLLIEQQDIGYFGNRPGPWRVSRLEVLPLEGELP